MMHLDIFVIVLFHVQLYTGKYLLSFYFRPCWENLRLGEFKSQIISHLTQLHLGQFKMGWNCRRAKITQAKNNQVYSIHRNPFVQYRFKFIGPCLVCMLPRSRVIDLSSLQGDGEGLINQGCLDEFMIWTKVSYIAINYCHELTLVYISPAFWLKTSMC